MPRRRRVQKRQVLPDPVYHSQVVTKFINGIMRKGKRSLAENIFYSAMDIVESKMGDKGIDIFKKALDNVERYLKIHHSKESRFEWPEFIAGLEESGFRVVTSRKLYMGHFQSFMCVKVE